METDLDYTAAIPEAAKSWITLAETRGGEIRTETLTFNVAANTETQSRSANIELVAGETVIETILIYQEAYYDPAQMVLKVEAKEYSSSAYNNKVYLPLYGAWTHGQLGRRPERAGHSHDLDRGRDGEPHLRRIRHLLRKP